MKKRVLMLGWEFPPLINGGLGIACLGLGRAMAKLVDLAFILPHTNPAFVVDQLKLIGLNHFTENELVAMVQNEDLRSFASLDLIPADLLPYSDSGAAMFAQNQSLYDGDMNRRVIAYAKSAAAIAKDREFDLIHAHDWMTFLAGLEIKARTGKPLAVHIHSLHYDRAGPHSRGWIFDLEKQAMESADLVIPVSRYTARICTTHYGIDRGKVHPVHNGVEPVKAFRKEKSSPEKLVLFLGRLTAQKGPRYFLEIAAKILKTRQDILFTMAGTGDQFQELTTYAETLGIREHLHFPGFLNRHEVNELLAITDVYCMPSVSEPFGISALEAVQFSIPVVISKQSGVAEVLPHARMADYWDIDKMAQHILDLLSDNEAHAQAVSNQEHQSNTWERSARRITALYANELHVEK